MQTAPTWREWLARWIHDPQRRQHLAQVLHIHPVTLTRWATGETTPHTQSLRQLLFALPSERQAEFLRLLEEEYPDHFFLTKQESNEIQANLPVEFYDRFLHTLATTSAAVRFHVLCDMLLQQGLKQFDPQRRGLAIYIAQCLPSEHGNEVHSLRICAGRGNPPWSSDLANQSCLLGAESLAGYAVIVGHVVMNPSLHDAASPSPGYPDLLEESAMAAPIMRSNLVAGSLLVTSTQPNFFTTAALNLLQQYAELLAVIFESEEYYPLSSINLRPLPPASAQWHILQELIPRIRAILLKAATNGHAVNYQQAELRAWQQIEAELFRHLYEQQ